MLLCERHNIEICGQRASLACTLRAIYLYERHAGRSMFEPIRDLDSALLLVWALLITDLPDLTVIDVGAMHPGELQEALAAAGRVMQESGPKRKSEAAAIANTDEPKPLEWRRLWSIGRQHLRLSEDEFWNLTPWMLDELMQRFEEQRDEARFQSGMVCAAITNCHIDPEKTAPYTPDEFVPGLMGEAAALRRRAEENKGLKGKLKTFAKVMHAKVTRPKK
jgi:hypothetical protein